jgi:hypothetical protein
MQTIKRGKKKVGKPNMKTEKQTMAKPPGGKSQPK